MTANATPMAIRSILRRQQRQEPLNILTFCTHERYEQKLCQTGHNFYAINYGKEWDTDYGKIPENYYIVREIPSYINFDLILCHTACDRLGIAYNIRDDFNIPILLHMHTLPDIRSDVTTQINQLQEAASNVDHKNFISEFSMNAWGYTSQGASFIEHGIETDFWNIDTEAERENVCLSVVNDWPNRDWCCGWELWQHTIAVNTENMLPVKVCGKSPGLSEPAQSIEHLRQIYQTSKIFYNTSLHSPVPTSFLEAMSCGCAVVSTATCMIPEIIEHEKNGLISNDPNELRQFLERLLQDDDLASDLGKEARNTMVEKYNLQRHVDNWNKLFYDTIAAYKD